MEIVPASFRRAGVQADHDFRGVHVRLLDDDGSPEWWGELAVNAVLVVTNVVAVALWLLEVHARHFAEGEAAAERKARLAAVRLCGEFADQLREGKL